MNSILIVDDNYANQLAISTLLKKLKVQIHKVFTGEDALKMIQEHSFQLILLDVKLPGISGYEVAESLHTHPQYSQIPIIFMTAYGKDDSHLPSELNKSNISFIFKPIDSEELLAGIRQLGIA